MHDITKRFCEKLEFEDEGLKVIVSSEDIYYCDFFTTVHLLSIITRAHNGSFSGHFPLCCVQDLNLQQKIKVSPDNGLFGAIILQS